MGRASFRSTATDALRQHPPLSPCQVHCFNRSLVYQVERLATQHTVIKLALWQTITDSAVSTNVPESFVV